jgi:alkylation response protein AidB-like acyl-CoA dehydrogenase
MTWHAMAQNIKAGRPAHPSRDPTATVGEVLGDEVRTWLEQHWSQRRPRREWLEAVVDAGWAVPSWPTNWYGRGLRADDSKVVAAEFHRVGAPGAGQDTHNLWANTLLAYGTDTLKHRLLRPLLIDAVTMCLLYSEPGAGSDLASVQTRADPDGDEFVVTGQKVWTSGARRAEYGMLVARSDWDVPKHQGISFFFLPMRQPGIEIRPIRQITGESLFNEVFIDHARVPADHVLGPQNGGWRVLQTALAYERSLMGDMARGPRNPNRSPDDDGEAGPLGAGGTGGAQVDLIALAKKTGAWTDPVSRQKVMQVHILRQVNSWNGQRAKAQLEQGTASPVLSLGKLAMSRILHEGAHVQRLIVGAGALLDGPEHPEGDAANFLSLNAYFTSIGGGTDQIQRNIIGERVLGLPKEPEVDRGVPFRQVLRSGHAVGELQP